MVRTGAQVGAPGNVEVWVAFCTLFVLASLIEYVFVHVLLCTVPAQLKHVCCKWTNRPASSCHLSAADVNAVSVGNAMYRPSLSSTLFHWNILYVLSFYIVYWLRSVSFY